MEIKNLNRSHLDKVSEFCINEISKLTYYSDEAKSVNFKEFSVSYLTDLLLDSTNKFVVAESDGIRGIAYGYQKNKDTFYVCWVIIHSESRNNNLGSLLLSKLIEGVSFKKVIAEIRDTNTPSRLFFEKNGFRLVGETEYMNQIYKTYEYIRS